MYSRDPVPGQVCLYHIVTLASTRLDLETQTALQGKGRVKWKSGMFIE